RALLTDVILYKQDCVILDMEAGLEHLGRGTAQGVDLMLVVAEPGQRAVETINSVRTMSGQIGIRRFAVIGNKVATDEDRLFLERALPTQDFLGALPFSETIRRADREGLPLIDIMGAQLRAQFEELWRKVKLRSVND
ncbi:MAG: hypothetical protein JSW66_12585, partial [Phycisphaerales bacterium]